MALTSMTSPTSQSAVAPPSQCGVITTLCKSHVGKVVVDVVVVEVVVDVEVVVVVSNVVVVLIGVSTHSLLMHWNSYPGFGVKQA